MDPLLTGLFTGDDNPAESGNTRILRQGYATAKTRASELTEVSNVNIISGTQGQRASKVYTAIAALLNMSITAASAEYIRKTAVQLPLSVIDLDEWGSILDLARARRGESKASAKIMAKQRIEYEYLAKLSFAASKTCKSELREMHTGVINDIKQMENYMNEITNAVGMYVDQVARCEKENKELKQAAELRIQNEAKLQQEVMDLQLARKIEQDEYSKLFDKYQKLEQIHKTSMEDYIITKHQMEIQYKNLLNQSNESITLLESSLNVMTSKCNQMF